MVRAIGLRLAGIRREGGVRKGLLGKVRVKLGFKWGDEFGRSDRRRFL